MPGEVAIKVRWQDAAEAVAPIREAGLFVPISKAGEEIRFFVSRPLFLREPVGYDNDFLDQYAPNRTFCLSKAERRHLNERGRGEMSPACCVFVWAYERSAAKYAAQRQSMGEPDPFLLVMNDSLLIA